MIKGVEGNTEGKVWTFAVPGTHTNLSIKTLDNVLRYDEAETNTLCVHTTRICHFSKKLKQFLPIFFGNANTSVDDRDDQLVSISQWFVNAIYLVIIFVFIFLLIVYIIWVIFWGAWWEIGEHLSLNFIPMTWLLLDELNNNSN